MTMLIAKGTWAVTVRCTTRETKMLVTDSGQDVLKARLSAPPEHPRALVTLCEGLALWHGSPLRVAVSADEDAQGCFERIFYGGDLLEPRSPLVLLDRDLRRPRTQRRIHGRGLGDFRQLRLVEDEP
jgi:hypothetical protein